MNEPADKKYVPVREFNPLWGVAYVLTALAMMLCAGYVTSDIGREEAANECRDTGKVVFKENWMHKQFTIQCVKSADDIRADQLQKDLDALKKKHDDELYGR